MIEVVFKLYFIQFSVAEAAKEPDPSSLDRG